MARTEAMIESLVDAANQHSISATLDAIVGRAEANEPAQPDDVAFVREIFERRPVEAAQYLEKHPDAAEHLKQVNPYADIPANGAPRVAVNEERPEAEAPKIPESPAVADANATEATAEPSAPTQPRTHLEQTAETEQTLDNTQAGLRDVDPYSSLLPENEDRDPDVLSAARKAHMASVAEGETPNPAVLITQAEVDAYADRVQGVDPVVIEKAKELAETNPNALILGLIVTADEMVRQELTTAAPVAPALTEPGAGAIAEAAPAAPDAPAAASAEAPTTPDAPTEAGAGAIEATTEAATPTEPEAVANDESYTVQPGDNMSKIAGEHGISLAELKEANPEIENFNMIHPGQEINIPGQEVPVAPAAPAAPAVTETAAALAVTETPATPVAEKQKPATITAAEVEDAGNSVQETVPVTDSNINLIMGVITALIASLQGGDFAEVLKQFMPANDPEPDQHQATAPTTSTPAGPGAAA